MTNLVHFSFGRSGGGDTEHRSGCNYQSLEVRHFSIAFNLRLAFGSFDPQSDPGMLAYVRQPAARKTHGRGSGESAAGEQLEPAT
jgi:hypothetical protein